MIIERIALIAGLAVAYLIAGGIVTAIHAFALDLKNPHSNWFDESTYVVETILWPVVAVCLVVYSVYWMTYAAMNLVYMLCTAKALRREEAARRDALPTDSRG